MSSSTITTSAQGLRHGLFQLPVADGLIDAYYARPDQAASPPVVLVVPEIFGLNEHMRDVCRRFAHQGYFAVSVDLFERQGDASSYTDNGRLIQEVVALTPDEQVMSDLDASAQWAASEGADGSRLAVAGFCWGGRIVWLYAAHNPACKAGAAWYGRIAKGHGALQVRHPIDVAGGLHGPVLGLYGGRDTSIPLEDVHRLEEALSQGGEASRASRIKVYEQAGHAFFADYRPSYRPDDAKDAWAATLDWFARYL